MLFRLIAVGDKMPGWVETAYEDYAKRLPAGYNLKLVEIPAEKRGKNADIPRIMEKESEKILATIKPGNLVIALDVQGQAWSTEQLAKNLQQWHSENCTIDLLIGGPDGLSPRCRQAAHVRWSLSPLTLPHPLVRIVVAEQLYRAWSILHHHPYHR